MKLTINPIKQMQNIHARIKEAHERKQRAAAESRQATKIIAHLKWVNGEEWEFMSKAEKYCAFKRVANTFEARGEIKPSFNPFEVLSTLEGGLSPLELLQRNLKAGNGKVIAMHAAAGRLQCIGLGDEAVERWAELYPTLTIHERNYVWENAFPNTFSKVEPIALEECS